MATYKTHGYAISLPDYRSKRVDDDLKRKHGEGKPMENITKKRFSFTADDLSAHLVGHANVLVDYLNRESDAQYDLTMEMRKSLRDYWAISVCEDRLSRLRPYIRTLRRNAEEHIPSLKCRIVEWDE